MSSNLINIEQMIEAEVQRRVFEMLKAEEEKDLENEEIIQLFAEMLERMEEKEQYKTLLKIIEWDEEQLYDFFSETPTWMGKESIRSNKRQIALQLLLESFIE